MATLVENKKAEEIRLAKELQEEQERLRFNPKKSRVSEETMANFLRNQLTGDLKEVPGIGEITEHFLKQQGIDTTFQLLGKFLSFKSQQTNDLEMANLFYQWLHSISTPAGYRAGIVHSLGEKLNLLFPGIYDSSLFADNDNDNDEE
jgi:hypothetical protein